jgi:uncharacterized cupin superfamily protein
MAELDDKAAALAARLIRNFHTAELKPFQRDPLYQSLGTRLATGTAARHLAASFDILPPGKRSCPYHLHHAEEEMFVVLEGEGTLRVAGEMLPIRAGDVMFIPPGPEYPHQIINTSDAPMKYLSIGTVAPVEVCEYPDSGKFYASAEVEGQRVFAGLQRSGAGLDYWEDEP